MKKILVFVMCAVMMICVLPVVSFAEEAVTDAIVQEGTVDEYNFQAITDKVLAYVQANLEELSVIGTLILTVLYQVLKHGALTKSIGILNNNAVTVAEDSRNAIKQSLDKMDSMRLSVIEYKEDIEDLLDEYSETEETKKKLEEELIETRKFLKAAKLANVEFANVLAELLVLANIPNSKKDELYARHLAAVRAIADAENTEVTKDDDGKETA